MSEEIDTLKTLLKGWLELANECSIEAGYCCCGDAMEAHGFGSGHSPVDMGSHTAHSLIESTRIALGIKPVEPVKVLLPDGNVLVSSENVISSTFIKVDEITLSNCRKSRHKGPSVTRVTCQGG